MLQFLAYAPYAVAGYCVAKVAQDTWPTLRSQLGTVSHHASRRGMDGERTHARMGPAVCAAIERNPSLAAAAASFGCFDEDSGSFVGGQYDGTSPRASQVSIYVDGGVRMASIHLGDNRVEVPTCAQPGGLQLPPGGGGGGGGNGGTPDNGQPDGHGGFPGDPCGPRRLEPRGTPHWRYCGDDSRSKRINARRRRR